MIVVKVELHSAITRKTTQLGEMVIYNDGTSHVSSRGNYKALVPRKGKSVHDLLTGSARPLRKGEVKDYPRLSYSMWRLVLRALKSCFPEEK